MTEINLCMITDNNYVMPTAVAITSAIQNKAENNVYHFYVLVNNITPENAERLKQMRRSDVKIDLIEVDASKYANINVKSHVPQSAAIKFDIPNILKTDKVLYIDGDIIVCKDLAEFYSTDLEDKLVAGVRDMVGELNQHFNQTVGCEKYFNSGVLLLDLKKMREGNYTDLLITAKREHPQWICMDQDAFNYILSSKTKWMDVKYNNMLALFKHREHDITEINDFYNVHYATEQDLENDTVIIHLAGTPWQRPWKYKEGAFCALWDSYYAQSPFKDIILNRKRFQRPVPKDMRPTQKDMQPVRNDIENDIKTEKKIFKLSLFGFIPLLTIKDKSMNPVKTAPKSSSCSSNIKTCQKKTEIVTDNSSEFSSRYPNVKISQPATIRKNVEIGKRTYIERNSYISMAKIGKFCSIGPNLVCGYGIHPTNGISTAPCFYSSAKQNGMTFCTENKIEERKPIVIGNDVFIGMNVCILDGVTIGDGAIIGAGAVVNKDIPPYAIAVGVPARVIKYRFPPHIIEKMQKIQWWNWPDDKLQDIEKMFFDIEEFVKKYGDADENSHTSADI